MVETIAPVVHGGRNRNYWRAVVLHTLGATISATLLGAFLGGVGEVTGAPWGNTGLVILAAVALLYLMREAFGLPIPLPQMRRQVPEWWRDFYSPPVAAFLYGIGVGLAFMTYLSFGTFAVVATGAFMSGRAITGALMIGAFGLARGASVVIAAAQRDEAEPIVERLYALHDSHRPRRAHALLLSAVLVTIFFALS